MTRATSSAASKPACAMRWRPSSRARTSSIASKAPAPAGAPMALTPLTDLELASRLSFFMWGSIPDDALLAAAMRGGLNEPAALEAQVRRMLADPKARSLSNDFGFSGSAWGSSRRSSRIRASSRMRAAHARSAPAVPHGARAVFDGQRVAQRAAGHRAAHRGLQLISTNRSPRSTGIDSVKGGQFRRVPLGDSQASWPARQGRGAHGHRVSESHGAGAARRVDPGARAGHAALRSRRRTSAC